MTMTMFWVAFVMLCWETFATMMTWLALVGARTRKENVKETIATALFEAFAFQIVIALWALLACVHHYLQLPN